MWRVVLFLIAVTVSVLAVLSIMGVSFPISEEEAVQRDLRLSLDDPCPHLGHTGDHFLFGRDGGLSKVDLLAGASAVVDASRPAVMIETTPDTHEPVVRWFAGRRYTTARVFDHGGYRNVVLLPS